MSNPVFIMSKSTVFSDFLSALGVRHTPRFANSRYASAPYASTVQGFRDLLDEYGVGSTITRLDDKSRLDAIKPPFVVQIHGRLTVVEDIKKSSVKTRVDGKTAFVDRDQFCKTWNGSALVASVGPDSGEDCYVKHRKLQILGVVRRFGIVACLLALAAWFFLANCLWRDPWLWAVVVFDLIGIRVCVMLVGKQLDITNSTTEAVCGFLRRGGCSSVMETSASKIFGLIGWGEVGLAYFSVSLVALLTYPPSLPYLALFNAFCLPYTVWSIAYQKFKAKTWCTLCCIVQLLQWLIFACYLFGGAWNGLLPLKPALLVLGAGYLLALLLIDRLIPLIAGAHRLPATTACYDNFRLRRAVFDVEQSLEPATADTARATSLIFGPSDAKDTVIAYIDPLSASAAEEARELEALKLKGYRLGIVFAEPAPVADGAHTVMLAKEASRLLTAVYLSREPDQAFHSIIAWLDLREKSLSFFDRLNLPGDIDVDAEMVRQRQWVKDSYLYAAPTFVFNGRVLSESYRSVDLLFLY